MEQTAEGFRTESRRIYSRQQKDIELIAEGYRAHSKRI
jgi:hypothetical protein